MDGIAMVIHMTRRKGRRFVEEALFVKAMRLGKTNGTFRGSKGSRYENTETSPGQDDRPQYLHRRSRVSYHRRSAFSKRQEFIDLEK